MPIFNPLKEENSIKKDQGEEKDSDVIIPAVVSSVLLVIIRTGSKHISFLEPLGTSSWRTHACFLKCEYLTYSSVVLIIVFLKCKKSKYYDDLKKRRNTDSTISMNRRPTNTTTSTENSEAYLVAMRESLTNTKEIDLRILYPLEPSYNMDIESNISCYQIRQTWSSPLGSWIPRR